MEQPVQLARARRLAALAAWKEKPFLRRRSGIVWRAAHLPPLTQESERVARQHDMAILAPFALLDANDLLRSIDMLDLQAYHLAGAQPAAVTEAEHDAGLETAGHRQQALHLVGAQHQRELLGLAHVIDLGGKIQSPQRHAEQEPHPGHDAVAIADAHAGLGQVQLKQADVLGRRRVRGSLQKRRKPLAAIDVANRIARAYGPPRAIEPFPSVA